LCDLDVCASIKLMFRKIEVTRYAGMEYIAVPPAPRPVAVIAVSVHSMKFAYGLFK
jgi:hypothetical protein